MNFCDRVKALKKETGVTNEQLSEATGISVSTLGKLLSGHTEEPKLSSAVAIADALGCSLEYLATGREEPPRLTDAELARVEKYRALDDHGARICDYILEEEFRRVQSPSRNVRTNPVEPIFRPQSTVQKKAKMLRIPLFADRVSAGTGIYLESNHSTVISVAETEKTRGADFALRVSGDSMEPRYHDGDILLVRNTPEIAVGELGIFICDGEGYFKEFGGDCLRSLNPAYAPIPLSDFGSFSCRGSVIGSLRAKN